MTELLKPCPSLARTRVELRADAVEDRRPDLEAAMPGRGPNHKDWNTLGTVGAVPASFATYVEGGKPGEKGGQRGAEA